MKSVYLDYAASTPMDPLVRKAMEPYFSEKFYNPSSVYLASKDVKKDIEDARANVAFWLGAKSSEIVFTAGGTEADNLAVTGVTSKYDDAHIVASSIEHDAVLKTIESYDYDLVSVDKTGKINIENLHKVINDKTVLVSIMYANNEIGVIQNLRDIAQVVKAEKDKRAKHKNDRPIYFHTDAAQASNFLDLHISRLGVDLMSLNGSKIYGPKQSGALYIKAGIELQPLVFGGGQEKGLRSGTENTPGIIGFSVALQLAQENRKDNSKKQEKLIRTLEATLYKNIDELEIIGPRKKRLPNNLSILRRGIDGERAVMMLDELGVQCSTGSACSALSDSSSHVLRAIGLSDKEASSVLRFSVGKYSEVKDIEIAAKQIIKVLNS